MKTLITAHSGADGYPDNSLAFVDYALQSGADALEIDVRRGAAGELMLGHDAPAADAPALREALRRVAAHPAVRLNCDLKEPGLEEAVCDAAREYGLAGRVILTGTVDAERCARLARLRETAEVWLNIEEYVPRFYYNYREIPDFELRAAEEIAAVCARCEIGTVNMNQALVTRRFLENLAARGVGLSAWTVNDEESLRWFFARGAANVTTRTARTALRLRGEMAE